MRTCTRRVCGTLRFMKGVLIVFSGLVIVFAVYFFNIFAYIKTFVLILRINPYGQTVPNAETILVVGDSTGYGTGAQNSNESIAGRMGTDFPQFSIKNNSSNGRTIQGALEVLLTLPQDATYKLILLQIGANDILQNHTVSEVKPVLTSVLREAKKHSSTVVMISSGNIGAATAFDSKQAQKYTQQTLLFSPMFAETARQQNMLFIDLFRDSQHDVFVQDPAKYLALDGLHSSSEGYKVWYDILKPTLAAVLKN